MEKMMIYDLEQFQELCDRADAAGREAVTNLQVVPMVVGSETGFMSGKIDYSKPTYFVEDGVCGFAWVDVFPEYKGNTWLGKEERRILKAAGFKEKYGSKAYSLSISDFNQSMQKKEAYARAFAKVLCESGIKCYSCSRLD
jgi:hypothetical protein